MRRRPRTRTPVATATNQGIIAAVTARAEEVPDAGEELRIEGTAIGSPEVLTEGAGPRLATSPRRSAPTWTRFTRLCAHLAAALPAPVVRHVALAKQ